jgi:Xaa-Pro aminopeptidase
MRSPCPLLLLPLLPLVLAPAARAAALTATSGVTEVVPFADLRPFLEAALSGLAWGETDLYRYYRPPGMPRFAAAVGAGRAEVWLVLGERGFDARPLPPELRLAGELREVWPEVALRDATPLLRGLREIKSPTELDRIQHAIDITGEAIRAAMRRALTAERENQIQATLEFTFRDLGACCWGFPSIVGAGPNATILHYEGGEAPVPRDGLVLLDVGAEVDGYTADVSRTFPADGTFSPTQRAVYQAVLDVWQALLPRMRPGVLMAELHDAAVGRLGEELLALGLITENVPAQVTLFFPHGLGHPLGLQVHDVFDRTRRLEPGMVWTLEPGLYVRPDDVTASEVFTALPAADQERVRAALAAHAGLGVRIEDDVLITEGAPQVLSEGAPRTIADVEAWMAGAR